MVFFVLVLHRTYSCQITFIVTFLFCIYCSGTLQMSLVRGVQPVYLRCNQGTIRWHFPLGALRIVLQHRTSAGDLSACIRRTNSSSGARIYLASKKRLHPIFREEDPSDLVRCVTGRPVVLYVEADPSSDNLSRDTMEFNYQLKKVLKKAERNYVNGELKNDIFIKDKNFYPIFS